MKKGTAFFLSLFLILLLAFTLGAVLARQGKPSAKHQQEMEALNLQTAAKMQAIKIGLWRGLVAIALLGATGLVAGLVRAVWQRSRLIHPHANGLFPVIHGRVGRQRYYHDPNRQLAGTVIYGSGPEGATVHPLMPPNDRGEQLQVTSQAQATQLIAAAGQGQGLSAQNRRLAERAVLATVSRPPPHLPDVVVLDKAIPEERHLLTALRQDWEDGQGERHVP